MAHPGRLIAEPERVRERLAASARGERLAPAARRGDGTKRGRLAALGMLAFLTAAVGTIGVTPPAQAAAGWLAPSALAPAPAYEPRPQVAMDARGDALAVWCGAAPGLPVLASFHPAGGSWQAPVTVTKAGERAFGPALAMSPRGEAVVLWRELVGSNAVVRAASGVDGLWQAPVSLSAETSTVTSLHAAIDTTGDVLAGWVLHASHYVAQAALRPAGGAWQATTTISPEAREISEGGVAGLDAHGDALVAWSALNGGAESAYRPAGGPWQASRRVSAEGVVGLEPSLAVAPQGPAVLAWRNYNGGRDEGIEAALGAGAGAWGAPTRLSDSEHSSETPRATIGAGGEAIVAWDWETQTPGVGRVQSATATPAGQWSAPVNVSAPGALESLALATDAAGAAVAAWAAPAVSPGASTVDAASMAAGAPWQAARTVSGEGAHDAVSLALDERGDGIAGWEKRASFESEEGVPEVAGYEAAGPALESVTIPGSGVAGAPVSFAASSLEPWMAAPITWSFGDGATATGASVAHTYSAPGTYTVSLTSADALGNATSRQGTILIVPAPVGGQGPASGQALVARPTLTHVRQSHTRWRLGKAAARISTHDRARHRRVPVGTTFGFDLNEAATVTLRFSERVPARRGGPRCKRRRVRASRRCTKARPAGALSLGARAGSRRVAFDGRLSHGRLRPGRYTVAISARSAAGKASATTRLSFTALR